MIVYLDSSAVVKCYIPEAGWEETLELVSAAELVATSPITRVEVASGLARAVRTGSLSADTGRGALRAFAEESHALIQIPMTERLLVRAQGLVWEHGLRGYDAVQLASAVTWRERVGRPVTLATFDRRLWQAGAAAGLEPWPAVMAA